MVAPTFARRPRIAVIASLLAGAFACATRPGGRDPAPAAAAAAAPESVAVAFFAAVAEERWTDAVDHLDLRGFDAYRQSVLDPPRPIDESMPTVEQLMESDPEMPRAAAEYQVKRLREFMKGRDFGPLFDFADVPTLDSLRRLSTADAAARWLRAQDPRWQLQRARAAEPATECAALAMILGPRDPVAMLPDEIVGVSVRDSVAWVLHHPRFGGAFAAQPAAAGEEPHPHAGVSEWYGRVQPALLELRRRGGGWRIMPGPALLGGGMVGLSAAECRKVDEPPPGANPPHE